MSIFLGVVHGGLWIAFFYYLFRTIGSLQERVRELEQLSLSMATLLSSHPDFKDRISVSREHS